MKVPHFSLQKILDLKELIVEARAVELEKSRQDLTRKRHQLKSLQNNKDETLYTNVTLQHPGASLNPLQLQFSSDYLVQLSERIKTQEKTVAESTTRVSDKHQALVKANQEKKALELLQSKHLTQFKKELHKKEQRDESEIALRLQGNKTSVWKEL